MEDSKNKLSKPLVLTIVQLFLRITVFLAVGMFFLTMFAIAMKEVPGFVPKDLKEVLEEKNGFVFDYFAVLQKSAGAIVIGYLSGVYSFFKILSDFNKSTSVK